MDMIHNIMEHLFCVLVWRSLVFCQYK